MYFSVDCNDHPIVLETVRVPYSTPRSAASNSGSTPHPRLHSARAHSCDALHHIVTSTLLMDGIAYPINKVTKW